MKIGGSGTTSTTADTTMPTIQTLAFDWSGRNFETLHARNLPLLSAPLDQLPLVSDHGRLIQLVRMNGSIPFAFRIADDHSLFGVWHCSGAAASVCTYWGRKLAHIDLVFASTDSRLNKTTLAMLPISEDEIRATIIQPKPLLVMCKVRRTSPGIAGIMGLIAYVPTCVDLWFNRSQECEASRPMDHADRASSQDGGPPGGRGWLLSGDRAQFHRSVRHAVVSRIFEISYGRT
jgi:hypothetical protein